MTAIKKIALVVLAFGAFLIPISQAAAAPTPAWQLMLIPLPSNLQPDTSGTTVEAPLYRVIAVNIGAAPTSGPVTFQVTFPGGVKPIETVGDDGDQGSPNPACSAVAQVVTCTTSGPVYPSRWLGSRIGVEVSSSASGKLNVQASISGGGAQAVATVSPTEVSSSPPSFDFLSGSAGFGALLTNADGSAATQAGSHPDQLTLNIAFPTEHAEEGPTRSADHVRDVITDLPQGLVINPTATPVRCTEVEFLSGAGSEPGCPDASEIGIVTVMTEVTGPAFVISHLYNMVPPPGAPAEVAFNALESVGIFIHLAGHLRSDGDYGISADANDILASTNNPLLSAHVQLWGDPSSNSHNQIRGECRLAIDGSCPVTPQRKPLLTMPSACTGPMTFAAHADSWEQPGVFHQSSVQGADLAGSPVAVSGCSLLAFEPTLTLQPDTETASSPTGVNVDLHVPQNEDKEELATSNVKDATVTLPEGLAVNPASADGLEACSEDRIGFIHEDSEPGIHFTDAPDNCPDAAKIGLVEVNTPLLDHPIHGAVYVATPHENPFGSLLAIYISINDPADGIYAKFAGHVEANPQSGQLITTLTDNPELPVEDFKLEFFGGARAALHTPAACGSFVTEGVLMPWDGNPAVHTTNSFKVTGGANGGRCTSTEAERPNSPGFEAGTKTPFAAGYSPFIMNLSRADGQQLLKGIDLTLPPGLTGKLAGIAQCSDSAIAAAGAKTGREELANPSCPAGSQVGEVTVGAGVGSQPYYTKGKIYLAGPYEGAPLSFVIITPAVAGPYDLGDVVVRAAGHIDPVTTQITVHSDPLPTILEGIPLEIRDVRVDMNRPQFTLNPTNCERMTLTATETSAIGSTTVLSNPFQVGGCKGLEFAPKLALRLKGRIRRTSHPRLVATLTAKEGEANISRAQVKLPHAVFLDQSHIRTVCTRPQFAAGQCPAGSVYGRAEAKSPLLGYALSGSVYLRSSSHKLPDLIAVLRGPASQPIEIDLDGKTDSVKGALRNTFEAVPDAPVSSFRLELFGGKRGLIEMSGGFCQSRKATVKLNGQNGAVYDTEPVVGAKCPKKPKAKKRGK